MTETSLFHISCTFLPGNCQPVCLYWQCKAIHRLPYYNSNICEAGSHIRFNLINADFSISSLNEF